MGNQGGKALKWLPAHSNSERSDNSKIALMADKHSMGLSVLSTHSAGRTAAVKAGRKPVHFSLDGNWSGGVSSCGANTVIFDASGLTAVSNDLPVFLEAGPAHGQLAVLWECPLLSWCKPSIHPGIF